MGHSQVLIPVTIVTGFLGAGKTTFINELTVAKPAKKFAIIENEFGEVGIDQDLLLGGSENIFEINKGCICCTVSGELLRFLLNPALGTQNFDHLMIETTGVAEPLSVAEPFLTNPAIQNKYRLDSIICLIDCELLAVQLREEEVVARQISAADVLVLSKLEQVSDLALNVLKAQLQKINPFAKIYAEPQARLRALGLTQVQAHDAKHIQQRQWEIAQDHQHLHEKITSYSFTFKEPLDYARFNQWVSGLMMFQSSRIYRVKGVLNFQHKDSSVIFQGVKNKFVLTEGAPWAEDPLLRESKIVFIGRELKKEQLQKHLRQCMATT